MEIALGFHPLSLCQWFPKSTAEEIQAAHEMIMNASTFIQRLPNDYVDAPELILACLKDISTRPSLNDLQKMNLYVKYRSANVEDILKKYHANFFIEKFSKK